MPFALGRPLGKPGDAAFQKEVLLAALKLLERDSGPILEDYPDDAEEDESAAPAACPVSFATAPPPRGEIDFLLRRFKSEVMAMRTWHDLARERKGWTTTDVSGLDMDEIATLLADFAEKGDVEPPVEGQAPADILTRASQELVNYYLEAFSAQPGQATRPDALANRFWGETYAALVIDEVRKNCLRRDEQALQLVGKLLLIPRNQMHRFDDGAMGRNRSASL